MLPNGRRRSPPFVAELQKQEGTAAKAFEFAILTAARTNEALGAVWSEIDFNERIWAVPSNRMKGGREHRVPLADKAIAILKEMRSSGGESGAERC
jgi:integrase